MINLLEYSESIIAAKKNGMPLVAFESGFLANGLMFPTNMSFLKELENIVSKLGAELAFITISGGKIRIGMCPRETEAYLSSDDIRKVSSENLPIALMQNLRGATTVSATMICADLAGIKVFAAGGIGGIHLGVNQTFDISADLNELAKIPITVVSAGAKSILDLPKTVEHLETSGVPIIGYKTHDLPSYWSRKSSLNVTCKLNTAKEIACCRHIADQLGLKPGHLVVNPIPREFEIPWDEIKPLIDVALADARSEKHTGKSLTPFVMKRLGKITKGRSLEATLALLRSNVRLASEISVELANL